MPVTGRSLCAALLLAVALAPSLVADTHAEVVDLFASMSAALTEDPPNTAGFMRGFDRKLAEYDQLSRDVQGLQLAYWVSSSLDFVSDNGDNAKRSVDVDWYMELRSKQEAGPFRQVRKVLHCELVKEGKHWRIVSISPASFFHQP